MSVSDRMRKTIGKLTQSEVAELMGEKPTRVNSVLNGKQKVPEDFLITFIKKFQVDANWLLLGVGETPKPVSKPEPTAYSSSKSCSKCERLEEYLRDERAEMREMGKELRELGKENRELVKENRDLGKENMKLVRQLASQNSPDLMPRNAKASKGSSTYSPAHCRLPEDARNKDKYEERQE
ncbi:helix-turn-helix domain-containing protein [Maridesulfovibrio sp.]|uniref:helix-turn-helix domain-containing protein n=1 Tax=Maridesulfovibrio sp. TaxID=2795000 RepID=UPI0029CA2311|nr:helix-turn-helix domain-containing protein [Maridesulfovibrio sp.]